MCPRDLHAAPLAERVAVEQRLWDKVRDETFADRSLLQLTHPTYDSFFTAYPEYRYVHEFFGPSVTGRRILEIGCGAGVVSVAFANSGAHVTAVDVSASALRVTRERAEYFGAADRVTTIQSPAELLDFPVHSFDLFFAKSVVHHLIIDQVMPRLNRFLVPGGRGAIFEPQSNPILDFARAHVPYPGKVGEEHGTDEFFTPAMIRGILDHFDYGDFREFRLLGMFWKFLVAPGHGFDARRRQERWVGHYRRVVDPIDTALLRFAPPLRRLAQTVVLRVGRRSAIDPGSARA
jgi:SAM-dependent methyltransferase